MCTCWSRLFIFSLCGTLTVMLSGNAQATGDSILINQLKDSITKVRAGAPSSIVRSEAAELLADIARRIDAPVHFSDAQPHARPPASATTKHNLKRAREPRRRAHLVTFRSSRVQSDKVADHDAPKRTTVRRGAQMGYLARAMVIAAAHEPRARVSFIVMLLLGH